MASCQYNRKYAIGILNNPPIIRKAPVKGPRAIRYNDDLRRALAELWQDSGGLCSKRLIPFLPQLVAALERHDEISLSAPTREKLLNSAQLRQIGC